MPRKKSKSVAADIVEGRNKKKTKRETHYLSTGCTVWNLACSERADGGFATGSIINTIGDSSAGKTLGTLTTLAEACIDPFFDDYKIIYDDAEHRNRFDMNGMFGEELDKRVQPPKTDDDGEPVFSKTVEEFCMYLRRNLEEGPCIYVLDSFDSIGSIGDEKHADAVYDALEKDKDVPGSYSGTKQKWFSEQMGGKISTLLEDTGSIVIIISQTRDNINAGLFAPKNRRSGGRALKFYADIEQWLAVKETIKKTYNGKPRVIGLLTSLKMTKNSFHGKLRNVDIPIRYNYGVDDVRSCIEFLISEKVWKGTKTKVMAKELDFNGTIEDLIEEIEEDDLEEDVREMVEDTWLAVEEALKPNRKKRY